MFLQFHQGPHHRNQQHLDDVALKESVPPSKSHWSVEKKEEDQHQIQAKKKECMSSVEKASVPITILSLSSVSSHLVSTKTSHR